MVKAVVIETSRVANADHRK